MTSTSMGGEIEVPEGCTLKFEGGMLRNGTVKGNGTDIIKTATTIFGRGAIIVGTWIIASISDQMFEDFDVYSFNALMNDTIYQKADIYKDHELTLSKENKNGFQIASNTDIDFHNATITLAANNLASYSMILVDKKRNVKLKNANVVGDLMSHDFVSGSTSEWGMGIDIEEGKNVLIDSCNCSYCIGDGIYLGGRNEEKENSFVYANNNIVVSNSILSYNRRNNMSIVNACNDVTLDKVTYSYAGTINGTSPRFGLDIEVNDEKDSITNLIIKNCKFYYNDKVALCFLLGKFNDNIKIDSIEVKNQTEIEGGVEVVRASNDDADMVVSGNILDMQILNSKLEAIHIRHLKYDKIDENKILLENCHFTNIISYTISPELVNKTVLIRDSFINLENKKIKYGSIDIPSIFYLRSTFKVDIFNTDLRVEKNSGIRNISEQNGTDSIISVHNSNVNLPSYGHVNFYNCVIDRPDASLYIINRNNNSVYVLNNVIKLGSIINVNTIKYDRDTDDNGDIIIEGNTIIGSKNDFLIGSGSKAKISDVYFINNYIDDKYNKKGSIEKSLLGISTVVFKPSYSRSISESRDVEENYFGSANGRLFCNINDTINDIAYYTDLEHRDVKFGRSLLVIRETGWLYLDDIEEDNINNPYYGKFLLRNGNFTYMFCVEYGYTTTNENVRVSILYDAKKNNYDLLSEFKVLDNKLYVKIADDMFSIKSTLCRDSYGYGKAMSYIGNELPSYTNSKEVKVIRCTSNGNIGTTDKRPSNVGFGYLYKDTTLGKWCISNGDGTWEVVNNVTSEAQTTN